MAQNLKKTPSQMPGLLRLFDDRYGIVWRIINLVRRFNPSRTLRFVQGLFEASAYDRPILIVGLPRSGTTFLFRLLRASAELSSLPREGHDIWRMFHHPRRAGWDSDCVGAGEVRRGERRFVNAFLFSYCGHEKIVEKTADNVMRIPYLLELFPDALFLVMKRNPCDTINSYINGWRSPDGRFRTYYLPQNLNIPGYSPKRRWCSTLIPGWRNLTSAPIPEIAFAQWLAYVDAVAEGRKLVPAGQWNEFFFEDLVGDSTTTMRKICEIVGIDYTLELDRMTADFAVNPVNAQTPSRHEKWRVENESEITALLPRIAAQSRKLGFEIDPVSGNSTPFDACS